MGNTNSNAQMLRDVPLQTNFDIDLLARRTEGLSGSDLKELCRNAVGAPVREHLKLISRQPLEMDLKATVRTNAPTPQR
jgi:SpoVK/Ycf46/Vps4 family AAA+-type ATPase